MELSPTDVVTRSALTLPTPDLLCEFASGLGRGSGDSVINHPDFRVLSIYGFRSASQRNAVSPRGVPHLWRRARFYRRERVDYANDPTAERCFAE
ncbi:MAG: hypothetical protein WAP49_05700 [Mycobacterium sp.]|jgi:hypothetical protein